MKNTGHFTIILFGFFLLVVGCSHHANTAGQNNLDADRLNTISGSQVNTTNTWNPNTEKLDESAKIDTKFLSLDHDVKNFYNFLHKKDWKATYELRWKRFKEVVPEPLYLSTAQQELPDWQLSNYEILSVTTYDSDDAILICKFVELPGPVTTYSVVDWRKEKDGVWRCDAAGPTKIFLFQYLEYNKKSDEDN